MRISRRAEGIAPFYAMEFARNAAELEEQGHHVVKLNIGEPDFGPPPAVLAAAREVSDGRPLAYTGALGLPELRIAIADFYGRHFGADVDPRRVAVTSGASAALLMTCAALIDPGDGVLIGDPSYPCNRQFTHAFGAQVSLIETSAEARFQLTTDDVERAWTDTTRGVIVATPSNPTGTSMPYDELVALTDLVAARGGWTIVDEIYLGLSDPGPDGRAPRSILAADTPGTAETIVVNSFSKYFGMTGWRLGWCIVPDELVGVVERLAQNFYVCPPTPSQYAALACFTPESLAVAEDNRREFARRRHLVIDGLARIGFDVPVVPDGAFYVYVDVSSTGLTAAEFCDRALREAHVALTPGKDFGLAGADRFVRLSYAASTEDLALAVDRLGAFVGVRSGGDAESA
ncbi:aminotransferase class I/II-fold pyridoxal phosphate-dependent enzyme [Gordonia amicalis]|uniref:aminotransferase class I/II-fold pyridoxal phosphate-dependent enzyme n=1 Tax=Gordonia amicalis TaxID=89053 RepID=UPI0015F49AFE|nr:aminotransferase class I/II-fold pyridoxal phosphate-dependent enzyme [Gordonia amicalis]MBA5846112.1 aminotransferase class I/II-fold pyridoxal phosphate-dependent enzyme [Gordonia amicalis]MDV7176006.1 aminotransferase class I/II-fold pyridoxal phosphate-dependent enzyme [Gordonia amicalis]UOG22853.1 aminotransferase class I/II-fold pyridoxal phosphate-dependent enzyme [Gordonia amicalis]